VRSGGDCNATQPAPLVSFGEDNASRIQRAIKSDDFPAENRAALVAALFAAIGDFNDVKRFKGVKKSIVVIIGSNFQEEGQKSGDYKDECGRNIVEIKQQLDERNNTPAGKDDPILLNLDFIGIGLNTLDKRALDMIAAKTGGAAHFVDEARQVGHVIETMEIRRVARTAKALLEVLNANTASLQAIIGELSDKKLKAAGDDIQLARDKFDRSKVLFDDLNQRQTSALNPEQYTEKYRAIYKSANECRELQQDLLSKTEDVWSKSKADDKGALPASTNSFETARVAYNDCAKKLENLVNDLLKAQSR